MKDLMEYLLAELRDVENKTEHDEPLTVGYLIILIENAQRKREQHLEELNEAYEKGFPFG